MAGLARDPIATAIDPRQSGYTMNVRSRRALVEGRAAQAGGHP
jgi:hypothetical protein